MTSKKDSFNLLQYLAVGANGDQDENIKPIPSLNVISKQRGVSISTLREQLEVAKALGLVEVRPRTGIRRLPYTFTPAVLASLSYAIMLDRSNFESFSGLRNHLETSYWYHAVELLTSDEHEELRRLVEKGWMKLQKNQVEIPHPEHREFHLIIYSRLNNPFVLGILEAYWEAYESVGLHQYEGLEYLKKAWTQHGRMVDSIISRDFESGYTTLVEHTDLIYRRS
jgi:DNA-binding FadR family transcriptional regulator